MARRSVSSVLAITAWQSAGRGCSPSRDASARKRSTTTPAKLGLGVRTVHRHRADYCRCRCRPVRPGPLWAVEPVDSRYRGNSAGRCLQTIPPRTTLKIASKIR